MNFGFLGCTGIPEYVCILKGVLYACLLYLFANALDEIINRKKYKKERELEKEIKKKMEADK